MCGIGTTFTAEVHLAVSPAASRPLLVVASLIRVRVLDRLQTLDRRERLHQGAIDGEVVMAGETLGDGLGDDPTEEGPLHSEVGHPLPIPAEGARIEDRVLGTHVQKPPEEKIESDAFDELSLGPDRVEGLEQQGLE